MDWKRIGQQIVYNWTYIVWTLICFSLTWFIFGASSNALITTLIIYAISIAIAFSPLAEAILRRMYGANEIETSKDIEATQEAFNEVYQNAINNHGITEGITLYLDNSVELNAYALGHKTVAITKGSLMALTEEEQKGLYAHEIGHIANWNTQALLLTLVSNLFLTTIIWVALKFLNIFHAMVYSREGGDFFVITWLFRLVALVINIQAMGLNPSPSRRNL